MIITGGSEGLGFCLAKEFLRRGCRVSIIARTQSKLDSAVEGLRGLPSSRGVQVHAISADVTKFEQVTLRIFLCCRKLVLNILTNTASYSCRYKQLCKKLNQNLDPVIC